MAKPHLAGRGTESKSRRNRFPRLVLLVLQNFPNRGGARSPAKDSRPHSIPARPIPPFLLYAVMVLSARSSAA